MSRAGGTRAASFSINSVGLSISDVVPSAHGVFKMNCRVSEPTNRSRPEWMPLWNIAFNQGGPNPDYVYQTTEIDAKGVYRISGHRGTIRFVEITQQATDMFSPKVLDRANVIEFRVSYEEMKSFLENPVKPDLDAIAGQGASYAKAFVAGAKQRISSGNATRHRAVACH